MMTTGEMLQPLGDCAATWQRFSASVLKRKRAKTGVAARSDSMLPLFAILFAVTLTVFFTENPIVPLLPAPARQAVMNLPTTLRALAPKFLVINASGSSAYEQEMAMGPHELLHRWDPLIAKAAARFGVSADWIRSVIRAESGGRTMTGENRKITSHAGAMGLMQVMPETYEDMREAYGLGDDPYAPADNIIAGTAYLRRLHARYGYPAMFAAYNDGPGNYEKRKAEGTSLPAETRNYVVRAAGVSLAEHERHHRRYRAYASLAREHLRG
jgi:hypothetical protein